MNDFGEDSTRFGTLLRQLTGVYSPFAKLSNFIANGLYKITCRMKASLSASLCQSRKEEWTKLGRLDGNGNLV